ncbi:MAG: M3 family metallopeptidase [Myxococcota bacterium]
MRIFSLSFLSRSALLLTGPLAVSLAVGCSPHDGRLPHQLPEPKTPNVPPIALDAGAAPAMAADAGAAPAADAAAPAPAPDAGAAPAADAGGTAANTPVPVPPPEPEIDPSTLEDGIVVAKRMLDTPQFGDAGVLAQWCKESVARAKGVQKRLEGPQENDQKTLADFDRMSLELDTINGLTNLLFEVSPVEAVRGAAEKCTQDISKFQTDTSLDHKLYEALSKVDAKALDAIGQRYVEVSLRDFRRAGVDKDDATRARISEINAELVKLGQEYSKAVNEDTRSISIAPEDAKGLPEDWVKQHEVKDGKITVTTNYPDFFPFETYSPNAALRAQLYREYLGRGAAGGNGERLKKILILRKELATLLGYPNWAEYATEDKMSGSAETVAKFIADIESVIRPRADKDLGTLLARKKKDAPDATAIEVFDRFYYTNLVRSEGYDFDAQSVRQYFQYDRVKEGIFALYSKLFGVEMTRIEGFQAWSPDVETWEMKRNGEVIGRFFIDMHPRENKFKHAAMFPIQTGMEGKDGGPRRLAWASLVCNFATPTADDPGLMEHSDVVTFFHEFGHLIHHLLAQKTTFVDLGGTNVEWDFVEAPSQLLEEWAWDPKVLATFAKNAKGQVIPKTAVEKMKKAQEFGQGVDLQRQVYLTAFSFDLHTMDPAQLDLDQFTIEETKRYAPFPPFEGDKLYANFGHLIDYTALYYTYQWSLTIAKDLFGRFKEKGLLDPKVAAEYTADVLEPGGTRKADELVKTFLGRDRNLDAYKAWIQKGP